MRVLAVFIILLFYQGRAEAQTAAMSAGTVAPSKWSGFATLGYSSNLHERDASTYQQFGRASLMVDYRVMGANLIRTTMSGYQEGHGNQENRANDSSIGWVNNAFYTRGKILTVGQQVRAVLPTSRESNLRDERRLGVTLAPIAIVNLTPVGLTGATLIYLPGLTKNFHKFEQNRAFENNAEYAINQTAILSWSVTDRIYIQPSFTYGNSWTYAGTKRDDLYQFAFEVGRSMGKGFIVALGVSNAGAIRNFEQGPDQQIELFNNRTASVYSEVIYAF
jgi:hypothetical protein